MSDSLFEMVEEQGEAIDRIIEKLDDVSIKDLYALAKRMWDAGNYIVAQEYYHHISLANPLEWEAPLRASLCGEMGEASADEWAKRPDNVCRYYLSTVQYLLDRDIPDEEKVSSIIKASKISASVLKIYDHLYAEKKVQFDRNAPGFKMHIQNAYIRMYKCLSNISICSFDDLVEELSEQSGLPLNEHQFEVIDEQKERQIKLNGICYLTYVDPAIEKKHRIQTLISALSVCLISLILMGLMIINHGVWYGYALELLLFMYSVVLFLRVVFRKNGIRIDSFLNNVRKREKKELSDIVAENIFSPMKLLFWMLCLSLFTFAGPLMLIASGCGWTGFLLSILQLIVFVFSEKIEFDIFLRTAMIKKYNFEGKYYII